MPNSLNERVYARRLFGSTYNMDAYNLFATLRWSHWPGGVQTNIHVFFVLFVDVATFARQQKYTNNLLLTFRGAWVGAICAVP